MIRFSGRSNGITRSGWQVPPPTDKLLGFDGSFVVFLLS